MIQVTTNLWVSSVPLGEGGRGIDSEIVNPPAPFSKGDRISMNFVRFMPNLMSNSR